MTWQSGDTASTYHDLRIRALTDNLQQLHRRLSDQNDCEGRAGSISDLVECLALALAEKGLPVSGHERLSLSSSRRFWSTEFTSRLDAILRQVDMSKGRPSANTMYGGHGVGNGGSVYGSGNYGGNDGGSGGSNHDHDNNYYGANC